MSGDINTSLGNCIIMSSIVLAYFEHHGIDARLANNGDDCMLFCSARDEGKMSGLSAWFRDFGFTLTVEPTRYVLEQCEFCQCKPVLCDNGWRMTRDPWTAMSKDLVSLQGWSSPVEVRNWAASIADCGIQLTRGVPIWEAFYTKLGCWGFKGSERVEDSGLGYLARGVEGCGVSEYARYSFWRAFGITPDQQLAIEKELGDTVISDVVGPMITSPVIESTTISRLR